MLAAVSAPAAWLDAATPANWNVAKAAIPTPLPLTCQSARPAAPPCTTWPATEPEDRILQARGWKLVGDVMRYGNTAVIFGASATDGMGRPEGFQGFVFVAGTFAGTLSPQIVRDSRDGIALSIYNVALTGERSISATFGRYDRGGAACCPNTSTLVDYRIVRQGAAEVVEPEDAFTEPSRS